MSPKDKDTQMVHVRLSNYMYNGLEVVSAKLGMTISDIIRMGINEILKKELSKKERDDLTDYETANFLIYDYRKRGTKTKEEDEEVTDEEDHLHELLQEIRSLHAEGYNGMGTDTTYNRIWLLKQKLAREHGYIYDKENETGIPTHYMGICGQQHEKEMSYLKKLGDEFKKDKQKKKEIPIEVNERDYFLFYVIDKKKQKGIEEILWEIRNNSGCALIELEAGKSGQPDKYLDKIMKYKKKLAMEYGFFYEPDNDPLNCMYNKDYPETRFQKEKQELKETLEQYELLQRYKAKYIKKYADDPGMVEAIKEVNNIDAFNYIRGVRNPEEIRQFLITNSTQEAWDYDDAIDKKEDNKKDNEEIGELTELSYELRGQDHKSKKKRGKKKNDKKR